MSNHCFLSRPLAGGTRFFVLQRQEGIALNAAAMRVQIKKEPDEKRQEEQADKDG